MVTMKPNVLMQKHWNDEFGYEVEFITVDIEAY
jgi:hypothetical protein